MRQERTSKSVRTRFRVDSYLLGLWPSIYVAFFLGPNSNPAQALEFLHNRQIIWDSDLFLADSASAEQIGPGYKAKLGDQENLDPRVLPSRF